jgi:Ca2+-binding EF-hand superfamily protein
VGRPANGGVGAGFAACRLDEEATPMDTTCISNHPRLMMMRPVLDREALAKAAAERSPTASPQADESAATAPTGTPPRVEKSESLLEQLKADWGKSDSPWDLNADGTVDVKDFLALLAHMSSGDTTPDAQSPLDQLLADWGQSDSPWDLNADGTVDIKDFLNLLAQQSGGVGANQQEAIDRLKADWGQSDSPWDLNADGTVNVQDFLALLAQLSGAEQPQPEQPLSPVEQLKADWGQSDSPWDLDGDGTVNVRDFLELLARMKGRSPEPLDTDETVQGASPQAQSAEEGAEVQQTLSPLQQLLADWGKSGSRWDLNGDGTVNVRDFLAMLARMNTGPDPQDGPPEPDDPQRTGHLWRRAIAAYRPSLFDHATLLQRGPSFTAVG